MKIKLLALFMCIIIFNTSIFAANPAPCSDVFNGARGSSFNDNWKFIKGDVTGASAVNFNDAAWTILALPHDWSISEPFVQNSPATGGGGYLNGGTGWYRKTFTLPSVDAGKRITIQFEGVYMNSTVWINGHQLGVRPYGFSTFEYDLTPYLKIGTGSNVIAVKVDNNQPNSRWYSGSGIYRNVWLTVTDPVHVAFCGNFLSTPSITKTTAKVNSLVNVQNSSTSPQKYTVVSTIYDKSGNGISTNVSSEINLAAGLSSSVKLNLVINNPVLWSMSTPYLYNVITQIVINKRIIDTYMSTLGVRTIKVSTSTGFWLNDENIKLHGVCMHHDLGSLGSAQNYRALERQVEILKSFGCNAIRTSHNPPAPELLEICDRLGLVVMDEAFDCWEWGKNSNDYHLYFDAWAQRDIQDFVRRDYNHPSVVMWSIGNEIPQQGDSSGVRVAKNLIKWIHALDSTHLITQALNVQGTLGSLLDIVGYNYAWSGSYVSDRLSHPNWVIMGSETSSAVRTRGVYHFKDGLTSPDMQCSSYDNSIVGWGHSAEDAWEFDHTLPYVVGQFIWTGFDYIGEPTPYGWPAKSSYFGIVDMCGFPKDIYYFYQSQWTSAPMVHILPHWNWAQGDSIPVWAYSNCDSVSLIVNGVPFKAKKMQSKKPYHVAWNVMFAKGKVIAKAYRNGIVVALDSIKTADIASKIELIADRKDIQADGYDQSFIETDIRDANGVLVPNANNLVKYSVTGPGKIVGVDNGNPLSLESFKDTKRQAFNGKCLAIVQSTGTVGQIVVTATVDPVLKNIALGKLIHSDSEDTLVLKNVAFAKQSSADSQQAENPSSAGNDANSISTRWCAFNGDNGHWWMVDLGSALNIKGTEIIWEQNFNYQYIIETSLDNVSWQKVVDQSNNVVSSQVMDDNINISARYVRITVSGLKAGYWASFYEFKVFDGSLMPSASSDKMIASKSNDGSLTTFWRAADGNTGHVLTVDLGLGTTLTGSKIIWAVPNVAFQYKIEASADSINWNIAADKTNNVNNLQTQMDIFSITGRYVRVTITGGTNIANRASIEEFELYDGSNTIFNPAIITIDCFTPTCALLCDTVKYKIKPFVNINNSGWQQTGAALVNLNDTVSFSPMAANPNGWLWSGPSSFSATTMQIDLKKISNNQFGIYKALFDTSYFNFQLSLNNDVISDISTLQNNVEIKAFPIPCQNVLYVNIDKQSSGTLSISDVAGAVMYDKNYLNTNHIEINTSSLQNGVYFLNLKSISGLSTKKIIVNK